MNPARYRLRSLSARQPEYPAGAQVSWFSKPGCRVAKGPWRGCSPGAPGLALFETWVRQPFNRPHNPVPEGNSISKPSVPTPAHPPITTVPKGRHTSLSPNPSAEAAQHIPGIRLMKFAFAYRTFTLPHIHTSLLRQKRSSCLPQAPSPAGRSSVVRRNHPPKL